MKVESFFGLKSQNHPYEPILDNHPGRNFWNKTRRDHSQPRMCFLALSSFRISFFSLFSEKGTLVITKTNFSLYFFKKPLLQVNDEQIILAIPLFFTNSASTYKTCSINFQKPTSFSSLPRVAAFSFPGRHIWQQFFLLRWTLQPKTLKIYYIISHIQ